MNQLLTETATDLMEVAEFDEREVWCRESISSISEVDRIVLAVREAMAIAGYVTRDLLGVRLALEEALVNAVKHGHRRDPAKKVRIRYQVTTERVAVVIRDQGPGFDRDHIPDPTAPENLDRPSGRGLLLMRRYMTGMRHNKRGNRVTLWMRRCCCRQMTGNELQGSEMNDPTITERIDLTEANALELLETRLQNRLGSRVRSLRLVLRCHGVVLLGYAHTYHAKQLAQHALMEATELPILANEIEVR